MSQLARLGAILNDKRTSMPLLHHHLVRELGSGLPRHAWPLLYDCSKPLQRLAPLPRYGVEPQLTNVAVGDDVARLAGGASGRDRIANTRLLWPRVSVSKENRVKRVALLNVYTHGNDARRGSLLQHHGSARSAARQRSGCDVHQRRQALLGQFMAAAAPGAPGKPQRG